MSTPLAVNGDLEEVIVNITAAVRSELLRLEQKQSLRASSVDQHLNEASNSVASLASPPSTKALSSGSEVLSSAGSCTGKTKRLSQLSQLSQHLATHFKETEALYHKDSSSNFIRYLPCCTPLEQRSLHGVVHHQVFRIVVAAVVVFNMFSIGWETQEYSKRLFVSYEVDFASNACAVFFWIELALRLAADKKDFFCS
eukprot:TRINITY_DN21969_c0_g1_i1.p1 TRINITY_DN21969_c0_g1~~TRINITY_DN21969_c0_g1_i1.p1  ORF type:complete len:198 (-),score=32.07 TRINITY_DN21969_c0_g1_i1:61-654(-)